MQRNLMSLALVLALVVMGCPSDPPPTGIDLPDTSNKDSTGDVGGDGVGDAGDAGPHDGANDETTGDVTTPCISDEDCDGVFELGACEVAACSQGECVKELEPKCCTIVDDCNLQDFQETKSVCFDLVCVSGECKSQKVEDCCVSNADCLDFEESCCDNATCNEAGNCVVETLVECCETSSDCDDGTDTTSDICVNACVTAGCLHKAPQCAVDKVYSYKAFDDGTLQLMKVFDENPGDGVTWHVTNKTSVSPGHSVRFGRKDCDMYYNGPVEDCIPTGDFPDQATPMHARLETASFGLDPGVGSFLGFWVRMSAKEGFPGQDGSPPVDIDYLRVNIAQGEAWDVVWKSTEAFGWQNTTHGGWSYQTINLSGYQGSLKVVFEFISYAANNYLSTEGDVLEGVYLDDIKVQATCQNAYCDNAEVPCESDGNGCTSDTCTTYANGPGGVCAYPKAVVGAECQPCGQPGDCGTDDCFEYACEDQQCQIALKGECCSPNSIFPSLTPEGETTTEGFESGDLGSWTIDDPSPEDNVGWQVDLESPYAGTYVLYFGDPATHTYAAVDALGNGQPAIATAWTKGFSVPEDDFRTPTISFWLNLSTEYDGSAGPGENEDYDTLSVWIERVLTGEKVEVWNSKATGNTTDGVYEQIGIDLSAYANEYIRFGFKFDSGDAPGSSSGNDFGGVQIDEVGVHFVCGQEPCMGGSDCDDADLCTTDYCGLGSCQNVKENPLCCVDTADCEDDNECTIELCVNSECLVQYDADEIEDCCSEGPWPGNYVATFDEDLSGFEADNATPPVVWFSDSEGAFEGGGSAHFANPSTGVYNITNSITSGTLTSPPITVPPYSSGFSYAEFMLNLNTEWSDAEQFVNLFSYVDELSVRAKVDGEVLPDPLWLSHFTQNDTFGAWITTRVDVTDFAGQEIQLVIEFNTGDTNNNAYEGPRIDNFSFGTTCLIPGKVDCLYGGDCDSGGDCSLPVCTDEFECTEIPKDTPQCCEPYVVDDVSLTFDGEEPESGWEFVSCEPGFAVADDSVNWQIATAANAGGIGPKSFPAFLYFGNGNDYGGSNNKGACGTATSPPITLEADTPWQLNFWAYFDIEKDPSCDPSVAPWADRLDIKLIDEESGSETKLLSKSDLACNEYGNWFPHSFDMVEWAGKTFRIRIEFTTWDNVSNDGKGLALDSIELEKGCPEF